MNQARADLIYDVGLYDGADTAYYLFRGYNVFAVDANPFMVANARTRFAKEIETGRLTLLNVGISKTAGKANFWISEHSDWSSLDETIAARIGTEHRSVSIPTAPFSEVLAENGIPHYLKIDIEGNDRLCVEALRGTRLPKYISVEAECVGDSVVLSDEEALEMLYLLRDAGYQRFKLVNQGGWSAVRSDGPGHFCTRLVNSAAHGRLRMRGLSKIAHRFTDSARIEALGFNFIQGCSGPWGEDIPGPWMTFEKARTTYLRERRLFFSRDRALYTFWYDWHATY